MSGEAELSKPGSLDFERSDDELSLRWPVRNWESARKFLWFIVGALFLLWIGVGGLETAPVISASFIIAGAVGTIVSSWHLAGAMFNRIHITADRSFITISERPFLPKRATVFVASTLEQVSVASRSPKSNDGNRRTGFSLRFLTKDGRRHFISEHDDRDTLRFAEHQLEQWLWIDNIKPARPPRASAFEGSVQDAGLSVVDSLPIPPRFQIADDHLGNVISYSWRSNGKFVEYLLGYLLCVTPLWILLDSFWLPAIVAVACSKLALHALAALFNSTEFRLARGQLTVTHGPVPFVGSKFGTFDVGEIAQLYCRTMTTGSRVFEVRAITTRNEDLEFLDRMPQGDAVFLEVALESLLGIPNAGVPGEYQPDEPGP